MFNIQLFNINNIPAHLCGVDMTIEENKNSFKPASCISVNKLFSIMNHDIDEL